MRLLPILLSMACLYAGSAHAIVINICSSLANWQADVGASTLQDFSSFSDGDSLAGLEVLPGVTLSTNMVNLEVHDTDKDAFGTGGRTAGDAFYQLDVGNAYRALALDIGSFESVAPPFNVAGGAVGPGLLEFLFEDGFLASFPIAGNDASANIFFGMRSDTPITRVRWYEALEDSGFNEETTLDNLRVGLAVPEVPEPSSLALAGGGLVLLARARRRRS